MKLTAPRESMKRMPHKGSPKEVSRWEAQDGSLHETKKEAELHDTVAELTTYFQEQDIWGDEAKMVPEALAKKVAEDWVMTRNVYHDKPFDADAAWKGKGNV